ncbi:TonB-dependent receptor [Elongatibacter sediminis]|uniref:TonB-dependent receptor n=1 Tax=Elongatibacter sediminis TaxID=3119006 RepID=A0AAW9R7C7_9GAMM
MNKILTISAVGALGLISAGGDAIAQAGSSVGGETRSALEEVVVTAQKRGAQILQDVPVSILVMSGEKLDSSSFEGVNDAIAGMAGVTAYDTSQRGGTRVTIRGVASSSLINTGGSTTAYYVDDLPFNFVRQSTTADVNAFDLERVEVLKGPQGTLYGAASLGGVVRVLTRDANLDEFEFKGRADLSTTEDGGQNYRGDVAFNMPLVPGKLAVRAVAGYQDNSGWIDSPVDDDVNNSEIKSARVKVGYIATDRLRFDFTAQFSRNDRDSVDAGLDDRTTPNDVDQTVDTEYDLYGLRLQFDADRYSIFSSSSWLDYSNTGTVQIVPGLPLDFDLSGGGGVFNFLTQQNDSEQFTQEVRVNSNNDGPWNWSFGGFYRDSEGVGGVTGVLGHNFSQIESEQFAFFGELTHAFMDGAFELTAGLRYFEDDQELTAVVTNGGPPDHSTDQSETFDKVTSRVVLTWFPNDDMTGYLSYGTGFRSGFIQGATARELSPDLANVKPDVLTNYEIGLKGTTAEGRVGYEVALYYLDWADVIQPLTLLAQGDQNVPFTAATNAGDASGPGVDLSIDFAATDSLTLRGGIGWNDLTFDDDIQDGAGITFFEEDSRLDESAEWTWSVGLDYQFAYGASGYGGWFSADANYSDALNKRSASGEIFHSDSIMTSGIELGLTPPSDSFSLTLYVDNLFDEDGIVAILDTGFPQFDSRVRPRTYGMRLSYPF